MEFSPATISVTDRINHTVCHDSVVVTARLSSELNPYREFMCCLSAEKSESYRLGTFKPAQFVALYSGCRVQNYV